MTDRELQYIAREIRTLYELRHINVIRLHGICQSSENFSILMEYAQRGSLRKVLDDDAFDPVRLALTKVDKGPLAGYTFERDGFDLVEAAVEPAESES